jgi:hypothetical protein
VPQLQEAECACTSYVFPTPQADLQALKVAHGKALQLRRSTAEASPTAPFPISLSFTINPPDTRYDVYEPVLLMLTLESSAGLAALHTLASSPAPPAAADSSQMGAATQLVPGVQLRLESRELPEMLRRHMARELCAGWVKELGAGRGLRLAAPAETLAASFPQLLALEPSVLEPYMGEDASGATVRRFAVLNSDGVGGAGSAAGPAGLADAAEATESPSRAADVGEAAAGTAKRGEPREAGKPAATAAAAPAGPSAAAAGGARRASLSADGPGVTAALRAVSTWSSLDAAAAGDAGITAVGAYVRATAQPAAAAQPTAQPSEETPARGVLANQQPSTRAQPASAAPSPAGASGRPMVGGEVALPQPATTAPTPGPPPATWAEPLTPAPPPAPPPPPGLLHLSVAAKELDFLSKRYAGSGFQARFSGGHISQCHMT